MIMLALTKHADYLIINLGIETWPERAPAGYACKNSKPRGDPDDGLANGDVRDVHKHNRNSANNNNSDSSNHNNNSANNIHISNNSNNSNNSNTYTVTTIMALKADPDDRLAPGDVRDVHEGVVEGRVDVGHAEDVLGREDRSLHACVPVNIAQVRGH